MTKTQKIWLWIFVAMFAVPEILWSPVGNFIYELYKNTGFPFRYSYLEKASNINTLSTVLLIQMVGLLSTSIYLVMLHKQIGKIMAVWVLSVVLFLAAVAVFFLFGFSISLRHIGF